MNNLLSVIIPVYNVEKYLKACIDSIIKQNGNEYEIILVDDGSTDSSGIICDKYASKYSFVKVLHKVNGGLSSARNVGLKIANSKYIMFLDSDDEMNDETIKKAQKLIETNDDVAMYICDYIYMSENGEILKEYKYNTNFPIGRYKTEDFLKEYFKEYALLPWASWQSIYNLQFLKKFNIIFDEKINAAEDTDFFMKCIKNCEDIYYSNYQLIKYRMGRAGSIITSMKLSTLEDILSVYSKIFYNSPAYLSDMFANLYVSTFLYIRQLTTDSDREYILNNVDWKILNSATKLKNRLFLAVYKVLGFEKSIRLVDWWRKNVKFRRIKKN